MMLEPYIKTILWAAAPFVELRASIPLGHLHYGLSIYEATLISILSIVLTTAILLYLLPKIVLFLENYIPLLDQLMKKIMARTHARHLQKMELIGEIALILFVAVPLPGSGAWTGVLVSYLFGVPYKKALILISTGIVLSGIIVAILTLFGNGMWEFFITK